MKLEISDDAKYDLEDIAEYTLRQFGLQQTENYNAILNSVINAIMRNPKMAVSRVLQGRRDSERYVRAGSHFIFYHIKPESVMILRVLHHKMDLTAHLPRDPY